MKRLGFTGTREGLTDEQLTRVQKVAAGFGEVHHGDCVGADAQMHAIAKADGKRVVVHPPTDDKLRAGCTGNVIRAAKPYFDRNQNIVDETDVLLAAPKEHAEPFVGGGGTWSTVRYARKQGHKVLIVWPDGTVGA